MLNYGKVLILISLMVSFAAGAASDPSMDCFTQLQNKINDWDATYTRDDYYHTDMTQTNTQHYDTFTLSTYSVYAMVSGTNGPVVSQEAHCEVTFPLNLRPPQNPPGPKACQEGSIINVDDMTVGEQVELVGTPFKLVYSTSRVIGRTADYKARVFVGDTSSLTGAVGAKWSFTHLNFSRSDLVTLSSSPNTSAIYTWDGLDGSGQPVESPSAVQASGYFEDSMNTHSHLPIYEDLTLGNWNVKLMGLGGWNLNIHLRYLPQRSRLYFGDGSIQNLAGALDPLTGHYRVVSRDSDEIYYFDSTGRHLTTNNSKTNAVIYTFNYDTYGKLTSVVDAYGNTTSVIRDGSGQLTGISSPYGLTTSLSLGSDGYLASIQNPNGETYLMTYYSGGLLHTFQKPRGQVSTMTYDAEGNLTQDSNSAGNYINLVLSTSYDTKSVIMSTAEGRQSSLNVTYTDAGFNRSAATASGLTSSTSYSSTYESQSNSLADGNYSAGYGSDYRFSELPNYLNYYSYTIGGVGNYVYGNTRTVTGTLSTPFDYSTITNQTSFNSQNWTSVFTKSSGTTVTTSPEGRVSSQTEDIYGKMVSSQLASFLPINYTYDTHGRIYQISQGTRQTTHAYNSNGFLASITNPLNQTTSYTYDLAGRVLTQTLPDTRIISYSYDSNGNLTSVTPPSTGAHQFSFNNFDLTEQYSPPLLSGTGTPTQYTYNNDKQLTIVTRPNGSTITYNYDATSGLLTSITTPLGTYSYSLDPSQNITSTTSIDNITINQTTKKGYLTYSAMTTGTGLNIGTVTLGYNNDFKLASLSVAANSGTFSASYTYDNDQKLKTVGSEILTLSPATGFVTKSTLNKIQESYGYDASFGELSSISTSYVPTTGSPTTLFGESYTRDALGRISTKSETIGGATTGYVYTYDSAGRLTDVTKNSAAYSHYVYDNNSNRTSGNVGGVSLTATYDAQDRLTAYNSTTYGHNLNGERTSKVTTTGTTTYTYDSFGNLKTVSVPSLSLITYFYDGLRRRVGKKLGSTIKAYWVYQDQYKISAEVNSSGTITKKFIYGMKQNVPDYMISGSTTYRIISDSIGSVRLVVNAATGAISQRMDYNEFGEVLSDTNPGFQPFGFAGGLYDTDTKLVHFGARDYDPETGRWLSKDPILFNGGDPNLYGYVAQDPVNSIDPTGLYEVCTTPLSGFGSEFGPVYHQYLCANGVCGGQTRTGNPFNSPGTNSNDGAPGSTGSTCEKKDEGKCMDQCIAGAIGGSRPNYSVINVGGSNCQKWANDAVARCAAQCGGN